MKSVAVAAGVLAPDTTLDFLLDSISSAGWVAATVGDKVVNGRCKPDDHVLGLPGTCGKGYEGVGTALASAGVAGTLARIVGVDSVEAVDWEEEWVDNGRVGGSVGLAKAAATDGDNWPGLPATPSSTIVATVFWLWLPRFLACDTSLALTASFSLASLSCSAPDGGLAATAWPCCRSSAAPTGGPVTPGGVAAPGSAFLG